jgi:Fe/S biogenesis protein NfuA
MEKGRPRLAQRLREGARTIRKLTMSYAGEHSGAGVVRFSGVACVLMTDALLLTITDAAREKILDTRAGEPDGDSLALWVEVSGVEGDSFTYDIYLRPVDEAGAGDAVQPDPDIPVVVPGESADKVRGSTLDLAGGGMVLRNSNSPSPAPAAAEPRTDLSGPVAQRVLEVLNEQVNPAIAAHGGRTDLVGVEEPVAYLHLSGGCQGCGLAAATLRQGIEAMIFEAVPEITEVVDVTDHASGTNPYYKAD